MQTVGAYCGRQDHPRCTRGRSKRWGVSQVGQPFESRQFRPRRDHFNMSTHVFHQKDRLPADLVAKVLDDQLTAIHNSRIDQLDLIIQGIFTVFRRDFLTRRVKLERVQGYISQGCHSDESWTHFGVFFGNGCFDVAYRRVLDVFSWDIELTGKPTGDGNGFSCWRHCDRDHRGY